MSGWIRLHRGWRDCDAFSYEPASEREAWVHLLETAAWKPMVRRCGKGDVVEVGRGQLHTAERTLANMWQWDRKRVKRFLNRLEKYSMISQKTGPSGNLITICNYDEYQTEGTINGTVNGTTQGPSEDHPRTTQEERKERKEGKEEKKSGDYEFEGAVIRLSAKHYGEWRKVYSAIPDLRSELYSLDAWWQGQPDARKKNWFNASKGMLNAKQQEIKKQERARSSSLSRLAAEAKQYAGNGGHE